MSISLCLLVWGNYWERFGDSFIDNVLRLDPAPDEVIISCPDILELPKDWIQIVQPHNKWGSWNDAMLTAKSEWVMPFSVDDEWFTDALDIVKDVEDDVDIISYAAMQEGQLWAASAEGLENILHSSHNPMLGGCIIRRSILPTIPFREVVWNDWINWMEIRKLNYKVVFPTKPIMDHIRREDSYSIRGDANGELQCEQMRAILRQHSVVPGVEFPPQILK